MEVWGLINQQKLLLLCKEGRAIMSQIHYWCDFLKHLDTVKLNIRVYVYIPRPFKIAFHSAIKDKNLIVISECLSDIVSFAENAFDLNMVDGVFFEMKRCCDNMQIYEYIEVYFDNETEGLISEALEV